MNPRLPMLIFVCLSTLAFADPPATQPSTQPAGAADSLLKGQFKFTDPSGDWEITRGEKDDLVLFTNADRDGQIQLALEPQGMVVGGDVSDQVARQFVNTLKQSRAKAKTTVVMPPTVEKDKRFDIRIHEKYKVGESTADQLHLYKQAGSRVLELTVNSTSPDPAKVAEIQKAGEDLLIGAKFDRLAGKKKPK